MRRVAVSGHAYWLTIVNPIGIAVVGAIGLNILVGFTGQISLGQGGFLAVGAYTAGCSCQRAGLPFPVDMACAVLATAAMGALFGLPALRLKGLYLAIATLACQEIILFVVTPLGLPAPAGSGLVVVAGWCSSGGEITRDSVRVRWYWVIAGLAALAVARRPQPLPHRRSGRSFMAVRDHEIAAEAIGVDLTRSKLLGVRRRPRASSGWPAR